MRSGGGFGYLLKGRMLDIVNFLRVLERVASGGSALDPEVVALLIGQGRHDGMASLTPREHDVMALMAEGCTTSASRNGSG